MARIIELPKLSPTMEEGTLVRWIKAEGEPVEIDDVLAEVETDKATMELRSFDRGTLLRRLVPEGTVARLGQAVAILGTPGEDLSTLLDGATSPAGAAPVEPSIAPAAPPAADAPATPTAAPRPAPASSPVERGVPGVILAPSTPRFRRLAREQGLVPGAVAGSEARDQTRAPASTTPGDARGDRVKVPSALRRTLARRVGESKRTIPHFYLEADLDVAALVALRREVDATRDEDGKVSLNDWFVRAAALALRAHPEANAAWIDDRIVEHVRVDVSIAVAIEDGLVVPVLRDADQLGLAAIARASRTLIARARDRQLKPEELTGGVMSVSNLGMYGIDRFAAVINPPESMILAVGAVREAAVVVHGQVQPSWRCTVTLSCDHRVVDGVVGARYLQTLRHLVGQPLRILT